MAELRLMSLEESLTNAQMKSLARQLEELGIDETFETAEEAVELEEVLSEAILTDFMDRLDAHEVGCTLFLPAEFEVRIAVGDHSVGSAHALLDALEELREELGLEEEDESEEEDDEEKEEPEDPEPTELAVIEEHLRYAWRAFMRAAKLCIEKRVPLHVLS
jgi:hypothetical protein